MKTVSDRDFPKWLSGRISQNVCLKDKIYPNFGNPSMVIRKPRELVIPYSGLIEIRLRSRSDLERIYNADGKLAACGTLIDEGFNSNICRTAFCRNYRLDDAVILKPHGKSSRP